MNFSYNFNRGVMYSMSLERFFVRVEVESWQYCLEEIWSNEVDWCLSFENGKNLRILCYLEIQYR